MIARDRVLVLLLILTAMLAVLLAGCNGVWTNAEFHSNGSLVHAGKLLPDRRNSGR